MFAFGLVFPLGFLLLLAMSIRAIVVTVWPPPKASREPACEICRYRVAGLSSFTCPECGTDLRATGIITLPMEVSRRGSLFAAIVGWLYLMCIVGGIGASLISLLGVGSMVSAVAGGSVTSTTPLTPASGAYTRIDATSIVNYGAGMAGNTDFDLVLKDGSTWKLSFLPLSGGYTITAPDGSATTTSPDDGKAADTFFTAAGLDLTDAKVSTESRELSTVIAILAATPYTPVSSMRLRAFTPGVPVTTGGAASSPVTPDLAAMFIAFAVGGTLWLALVIAGIMFIVSRRRKLLRQYPSVKRPPPPGDTPDSAQPNSPTPA
jgi:hypothetical protein